MVNGFSTVFEAKINIARDKNLRLLNKFKRLARTSPDLVLATPKAGDLEQALAKLRRALTDPDTEELDQATFNYLKSKLRHIEIPMTLTR